jgi:hypothetical protein
LSQVVVGVSPPQARAQRARLFESLQLSLDVRFEARAEGERGDLAGELVWGDSEPAPPAPRGIPRLTLAGPGEGRGRRSVVRLHAEPSLDRRLWGIQLAERLGAAVAGQPGDRVLASSSAGPVWIQRPDGEQQVAVAPDELEPHETLRDRLRPERSLALLPIVELARRAAGQHAWRGPALRACFLFDDPNLHWPSYGHLRFAQLCDLSARHGYHVAVATVPLDGWFIHPAARRLFAGNPHRLSLIVHGNEHLRRELARPRDPDAALALSLDALARVQRLERRTGLRVGRIMAPPHGACSVVMAQGLLRAGFEALTVSRPYPWLDRPPADRSLAGWWPAELVAGGLPVLPRCPLDTPMEDLALRAYLDQPLILYGHHTDLADGPERLGRLCDEISRLGNVRWRSMERIARTNVAVRQIGARLDVRLHSRCAEVEVPDGARELVIDLAPEARPQGQSVQIGDQSPVALGAPVAVAGGQRLTVRLVSAAGVPSVTRRRRARPWPIVRRGLVEARDRSMPLLGGRRSLDSADASA